MSGRPFVTASAAEPQPQIRKTGRNIRGQCHDIGREPIGARDRVGTNVRFPPSADIKKRLSLVSREEVTFRAATGPKHFG